MSPRAHAAPSDTPSPTASATPADPAAPNSNAVFGLQPASVTALDQRPYFSFAATPGSRVDDHVAVVNVGNATLDLAVYPTDATSRDDGVISFKTADQKPTDAGSWITLGLAQPSLAVPPRNASGAPGAVIVPFTVKVPPTAAPGDHVGAVIASLQVLNTNPQGATVKLDQRVAMRVYIRVSGAARPALSIDSLTAKYDGVLNPVGGGRVTVDYTVRNTGNLVLGARQKVTVKGLLGGTKSAAGVVDIPPLLPGAVARLKAEFDDVLPTIRITAKVEVTPTPALASSAQPAYPTVSRSTTVGAIPWVLVLIVCVMVLVLVIAQWRRRKTPPAAADRVVRPMPRAPVGAHSPLAGGPRHGARQRADIKAA